MQNINSGYCQLQSSVATQDLIIRKREGGIKSGFGSRSAFMNYVVQSNIPSIIIMSPLCVLLTPCAQSHGDGTEFVVGDDDELTTARRRELQANSLKGKLSSAFDLSFGSFVPLSWAFSVNSIRYKSYFNHPSIVVSGLSSLLATHPFSFIMVRTGKRRCDSGLPSSAGLSEEPEQAPINLSSTHEVVPPLSSRRKHIPNSAFQTTHFKFQSNFDFCSHLYNPFGRGKPSLPLACIAPDPSQGSEHSTDKDSPEKSGQEESPKIIPPLEDIEPVVEVGTQSVACNPVAIPDSELDGTEILRTNSMCMAEEKNHGKVKEG